MASNQGEARAFLCATCHQEKCVADLTTSQRKRILNKDKSGSFKACTGAEAAKVPSKLLAAAEFPDPQAEPFYAHLEHDHAPACEYWIVMDFEATCADGDRSWKNEIIEFPAVLVSVATHRVVDEFRCLVRPTECPTLTAFYTQLTSITQADVASASTLPEVLAEFDAWLARHSAGEGGNALSVWCGDWDLRTCLPNECAHKGLSGVVPPVLNAWCNVKVPFCDVLGHSTAMDMAGMLRHLRLPLTGHHHLGIDDARNIAKIAIALADKGGECAIGETAWHEAKRHGHIYRKRRGPPGSPAASATTGGDAAGVPTTAVWEAIKGAAP